MGIIISWTKLILGSIKPLHITDATGIILLISSDLCSRVIIIKLKYPESFKVAEEIGKAINEDFSLEVAEDEIGYLALHVERIRKNE